MPDYLQREQAPLGIDQWAAIDQIVVRTAQSMLVGRRFLALVGPFGPGVEVLPNDILVGSPGAHVDLLGNAESNAIGTDRRTFLPIPLIYQDFWVHWRDLESSRQLGVPLDLGKAAAAAAAVGQAEDRLIFDGNAALDLPGLRNVPGRQSLPMQNWASPGQAFADVVEGVRVLINAGFNGPYALAVSPRLYADLNRIFDNTGVLELEQVQKLARRGVFATAVLPEPAALLVDSGAQNMDLGVGVDLSTAYVESSNLNHLFRVIESVALRVRRPAAIVTYESGPGRAGPELPAPEAARGRGARRDL